MKVSDLRGILQYVPRFRDRIFVIAIDGEIIAAENFANILLDLAVLRSLNIKIVLVHGVSFQIEKLAQARNTPISNHDGTGITDFETLQIALDASTRLTNDILQGLTSVDLRAAFANAVIAHPAGILSGIDYLFTGKVEKIDAKCLHYLLDEGIIPIIPPLGYDGEGKTYRVNSDAAAVDVAEALHAAKVIFISRHDGLQLGNEEIIRQLSVRDAEELIKRKRISAPGVASKIAHGAQACRLGISRVHLINGNIDEALLTEVFSNEGIGTMIHSNEYQQMRRMMKKDVRQVMSLIKQSVHSEELIRRTRAELLQQIEDYWLLEVDRNIVGCVAIHPYESGQCAELACLYVSRNHENQGYGRKLMAFVENLARERGYAHLFALSTQAFAYLQQKGGFHEATIDILPQERQERLRQSGRNSRILVKNISPR